jgi:hypothetical protein
MTRHIRNAAPWAVMLLIVACGDGGSGQSGLNLNNWSGDGVGSWTEPPGTASELPASSTDQPPRAGDPYPGADVATFCQALCATFATLPCSPFKGGNCFAMCMSESDELLDELGEGCLPEMIAVLNNCTFFCDEDGDVQVDFDSCPAEAFAYVACAQGSSSGGSGGGPPDPEPPPNCSPPSCAGCDDNCEQCMCALNDTELCADSCQ